MLFRVYEVFGNEFGVGSSTTTRKTCVSLGLTGNEPLTDLNFMKRKKTQALMEDVLQVCHLLIESANTHSEVRCCPFLTVTSGCQQPEHPSRSVQTQLMTHIPAHRKTTAPQVEHCPWCPCPGRRLLMHGRCFEPLISGASDSGETGLLAGGG